MAVLALLSLVAESMRNDGKLSAAAYYARLIEMIGGDPDDRDLDKRVRDGHRRDVVTMWADLNAWLEHDSSRGVPTAYAFDYRTYIGPALSQALVREADRQQLTDLFAWAHLIPGQNLARGDMVRLLKEWLPRSKVSQGLKTLCCSDSTLEQVADVALAELRAWNGAGAAVPVGRSHGLTLVGRLRRRPRLSLELALLARLPQGEAHLAAGSHEETVNLSPDSEDSCIVETHAGTAALSSVTTVRSSHGGVMRSPTRVVMFRVDPDRGRLVEVPRAVLGERHAILVADAAKARIEQALTSVARPRWQIDGAARGVPQAWTLLTDVEIVALGEFPDPERNVLVPTSWTQLTLHGGFRVPGRSRWLLDAPPEVSISVLDGGRVQLTITRLEPDTSDGSPEDGAPTTTIIRDAIEGVETFRLDESDLDPGRYYLTATRRAGSQVVARAHLDLVEPNPDASHSPTGHDPAAALWPVSATEGGILRGAIVPDGLSAEQPKQASLAQSLTPIEDSGADDELPSAYVPTDSQAPECFRTGLHLFRLPPGRHRKGLETSCEHCGMEKFIPPRPSRDAETRRRSLKLPPLAQSATPHEDDVLHALSVAGRGSRNSLERVIEQVDDAPWALDERARTLSALGHVDLTLDGAGRLRGWAVAPASIMWTRSSEAVLCGWRSNDLLRSLPGAATAFGARLVREPNGEAPDRVAVLGLCEPQLRDLCARVSAEAGVDLRPVTDPATSIASALPRANELVAYLSPASGDSRLERLHPVSWAWVRSDGVSPAGAYRTSRPPRRYFYFDGSTLRACEPRLARWLSVHPSARRIAYDPDCRTLMVPLGGRLPGLWERAAVLGGGRSPLQAADRIAYRDVEPATAEVIAATLATRTEEVVVA